MTQSGADDRVSIPSNIAERLARVEEQIPGLDRHMIERFTRVDQRFDALDEAASLLATNARRVEDRLAAEATEQKARDERSAQRAQEQSNEWRGTVTDLAGGKADIGALSSLRAEMSAKITGVESTLHGKIDGLTTLIGALRTDITAIRSAQEGSTATSTQGRALIFGLLAAAGTVVGIVVAVLATQ